MSGDMSPFREILSDDLFPEVPNDDNFSFSDIMQQPYEDPFRIFDNISLVNGSVVLPIVGNDALHGFLPPSAHKRQRTNTVKTKRTDFKLFLAVVSPRKCEHCHATETPQWRGGPSGKGTLCNACGIRFSSNRLYPEYRPSTSSGGPVGGEYSNRHKNILKIREERKKKK